jgi:hypothetical protein
VKRKPRTAPYPNTSNYVQSRSTSHCFLKLILQLPYFQFSFDFPHGNQDVFWKCRVCDGSTACQPATADELV